MNQLLLFQLLSSSLPPLVAIYWTRYLKIILELGGVVLSHIEMGGVELDDIKLAMDGLHFNEEAEQQPLKGIELLL